MWKIREDSESELRAMHVTEDERECAIISIAKKTGYVSVIIDVGSMDIKMSGPSDILSNTHINNVITKVNCKYGSHIPDFNKKNLANE